MADANLHLQDIQFAVEIQEWARSIFCYLEVGS